MKTIKQLVMANPYSSDNELLIKYYEEQGLIFTQKHKDLMTSQNFGISTIERKFRDFNSLRHKPSDRQQKMI